MRPFLLAILCLMPAVAQAQLFPNAPWNQSSSGCYTDSNGNTVCPNVTRQVVRQSSTAYYPSVSSSVPYSAPVVSYGSTGSAVSYGSTGTPTVAPSADSVSVLVRKSDFRKSLMAAAKASREKGEITVAEYFKIAAMSRIPKVRDNLEAAVHEAAIEEGIATTQAPDWDAIIGFIEKLIPLIIQLLDLFS